MSCVTKRERILGFLAKGPRTNAELQDFLCDHSGGVARTMAELRYVGLVRNIASRTGRGSIAIYALPSHEAAQTASRPTGPVQTATAPAYRAPSPPRRFSWQDT